MLKKSFRKLADRCYNIYLTLSACILMLLHPRLAEARRADEDYDALPEDPETDLLFRADMDDTLMLPSEDPIVNEECSHEASPISNPSDTRSLSAEERCYFERDRYREVVIKITDPDKINDSSFKISDENGNLHIVSVGYRTAVLDVGEVGEYKCIYKYNLKADGSETKGRALCIAEPEQYKCFEKITDLEDRAENIRIFSECPPEQKHYILKAAGFDDVANKITFRKGPNEPRDVIRRSSALAVMYELCEERLPAHISSYCKELLSKASHDPEKKWTQALADILYSFGLEEERKPFKTFEECKRIFSETRYGNEAWTDDLIRQLLLLERCDHTGAVFVFVGEPGTGKTQIGKAVARCCQKNFIEVRCNNKSALDIGGAADMYQSARHGVIQSEITLFGKASVIMLDEYDKMTINDRDGNPYSYFDSVFDERQTFTDTLTNVPVPTCDIIWILTANSKDDIPSYIIDRFGDNVFFVDPYSVQTKTEIGKKFLLPKLFKQYHFTDDEVIFTDDGILAIASATSDAGARSTDKKLLKVLSVVNEHLQKGFPRPIIVDRNFAISAINTFGKNQDDTKRTIGFIQSP